MADLISIKEYARQRGKSVQAVYQQMSRKTNAEVLKGHIVTKVYMNKKTKFLDEFAVEILDHGSSQTPSVILQTDDKEKIEALEQENKVLLEKIALQADKLAAQSEELRNYDKLMLESGNKLKLAESRADEAEQRAAENEKNATKQQETMVAQQNEIAELKAQLEAERNRKLSFSERFRGRKKHRD